MARRESRMTPSVDELRVFADVAGQAQKLGLVDAMTAFSLEVRCLRKLFHDGADLLVIGGRSDKTANESADREFRGEIHWASPW